MRTTSKFKFTSPNDQTFIISKNPIKFENFAHSPLPHEFSRINNSPWIVSGRRYRANECAGLTLTTKAVRKLISASLATWMKIQLTLIHPTGVWSRGTVQVNTPMDKFSNHVTFIQTNRTIRVITYKSTRKVEQQQLCDQSCFEKHQ